MPPLTTDRPGARFLSDLRRGRWCGLLAALVLMLAAGRVVLGYAWVSATYDEGQHIAAGLEWLEHGTYTLEPENPPLSRIALAIGPYLAGYRLGGTKTPNDLVDSDDPRDLARARMGSLVFLVVAGAVVFAWGRRVLGPWHGLAATGAFVCVPSVLAHGGLATTDMAFAATFSAAVLALPIWLDEPTNGVTALLGATVGFALAAKFTALALLPVGAALVALRVGIGASPRPPWKEHAVRAPLAALVAAAIVWGAYRFSFGVPDARRLTECGEPGGAIRATLGAIGRVPMPAPEMFDGLMDLCAHNAEGHGAYLLGRHSAHGFAAFYPVAILVKSPIPFLALAVIGTLVALTGDRRKRWPTLAPPVAATVLVLTCAFGNINIGLRHVLAIYPLLALPAALGLSGLWQASHAEGAARVAAVVLGGWLVTTPFLMGEDALGYFNEIAAPRADEILVDSDLDWGQGLLQLERELAKRDVREVSLAYFGKPTTDFCRHALPAVRWLRPGVRTTGWIAISQGYRHGMTDAQRDTVPGCGTASHREPVTPDGYTWLDAYVPVAHIGRSMLLYDVPP